MMVHKRNETLVPPSESIEIDAMVNEFNNNYDNANKSKS
jgi:hypothetical protein